MGPGLPTKISLFHRFACLQMILYCLGRRGRCQASGGRLPGKRGSAGLVLGDWYEDDAVAGFVDGEAGAGPFGCGGGWGLDGPVVEMLGG